MENAKKIVGGWVDLSFKFNYYRNLIMAVIFLAVGIILIVVSIFVFFSSLKWGLIILVISLVILGLSWFCKICANSAKRAGKQVQESIANF